ncbi:MAG: bifunctional metallophosphatase/5'-nucleotidase [Acidobacteria bacterium]|nr:bifunctional metallophosphatase/5'-nucleotidase [Acidobacteriota bacterium]
MSPHLRRHHSRSAAWLPLLLALGLIGACALESPRLPPAAPSATPAPAVADSGARSFTLISVNDIYRIEGLEDGAEGGPARIRSLRAELELEHPDLLLFHAGDLLYPSLLSRRYDGEQMIDVLNRLDGDGEAFDDRMFVTFGNHELDRRDAKGEALLAERVAESQFRWVSSNITFAPDAAGQPIVTGPTLVDTVLTESHGVRVGIFGLTLSSQHPPWVVSFADPIEAAREKTAQLRRGGAEVVIGLTHLPVEEDLLLLETLRDEGPDLVLGGHEHSVQERQAGGRWVLKADADARSAIVAQVTVGADGSVSVEHGVDLLEGDSPAPDAQVLAVADGWVARFDQEFCADRGQPPGCLAEVVGHTRTRLVAEELKIRAYETSLGDWVADRLLAHHRADGAQVAVINSGGLRLNRDIVAGADIVRRDIEELFAYPSPTVVLEMDGATLIRALEHSVEDWNDKGWFLQVAGIAFRQDVDRQTVTDVTLLTPDGPRPLDPTEPVRVATVAFLANPQLGDRDGYTMFDPKAVIATGSDLKGVVLDALQAAGPEGIAPTVEGRICNSREGGVCLAVGR